MDTVDVLTMAVDVARMLRSTGDVEAVFGEACRLVGCASGDESEPLSVRVARLVEGAGERRAELNAFLYTRSGPFLLNRPLARVQAAALRPEDPEAETLLAYVESDEGESEAIDLLGEESSPYKIGSREIVRYIQLEGLQQPTVVRGLIVYPLERAVLFAIDLKQVSWYLWDILTAFSDQYVKIYEDADAFGVWGHDLDDLWIEQLCYYPRHQVIYPFIGS